MIQVGVLVIPRRLEIFGRIAEYVPDQPGSGDPLRETGIAVNWYLHGDDHKLQFDVRRTVGLPADLADGRSKREFRLQYQIVF